MCFRCSPAHVMPLLEIVRTNQTSPQVIVDLLDIGKKIKKTPVVVGNCTGFAVNRMFFPYTQAAFLLVERGTDLYLVDRAITKFGMPMGPFRYVIHIQYVIGDFLLTAAGFETFDISLNGLHISFISMQIGRPGWFWGGNCNWHAIY